MVLSLRRGNPDLIYRPDGGLNPGNGLSIDSIASLGEDGMGELYIVDLGGEIFKMCSSEGCSALCKGNFDCDADVDSADAATF